MKIFEISSKLGLMPAYDDIVIRLTADDGSIKEFDLNHLNFNRDYKENKTIIELKEKDAN